MPKTWFITGASRGFGRLWADAALGRGDRVAATARDVTALDPLVERFGDAVVPIGLDVTDRAAVGDAVAGAVDSLGRLDVVVNNAGYGHLGMVEEVSESELRAEMETNFFGAVWVTQAVLPVLRRQARGHILQVTSEGGVRAFPGFGAYHASKWALEGLSESLAQEVASFGVHVTNVEPGPYATGFGGTRSLRASDHLAAYEPVRAGMAPEFVLGDPEATCEAILAIVDDDDPPLRIILGRTFAEIEQVYEERLRTWREWEPLALAAFGGGESSPAVVLTR